MHSLGILLIVLVLKSGERIETDEAPRTESGVVVFKVDGQLFSMPVAEVDEEATRLAAEEKPAETETTKKLKVTPEERDRLLRELSKNHSGTPAAPLKPSSTVDVVEKKPENDDEAYWRRRAKDHDEAVLRAKEELQFLHARLEKLRAEINTFLILGFRPHQFTWQTSRLVRTEEQIPRAELELTRAERARTDFREEARRAGVMPGWLR
ncbi:MAG TPA: hypothetical protein VGF69_11240 [Thermoanaerobaculia bacterium]|jgi:hypothetical protein